jgi:predicted ATPase
MESGWGFDRTLIIETHSDHILGRVARRIAEGVIPKDAVAIYYFRPTPEGTAVEEVTLNENGQYVKYPDGFFEEGFEEAFAHMEAMSKHAR